MALTLRGSCWATSMQPKPEPFNRQKEETLETGAQETGAQETAKTARFRKSRLMLDFKMPIVSLVK